MPHLVSLTSQYAPQGLRVVATHVQNATDQAVTTLCRQSRVNYTVVKAARVKGDNARTIPHLYLFDHTGECVWQGLPSAVTQELKDVMAKAPHPLLAGLELSKLQKMNAAMKQGVSCGKVIKQLKSKLSASDAETAAEAKAIVDRLMAHAKKLEEDSEKLRTENPYGSYALLEEIKAEFAGTEPATAAAAKLKALAKDKEFMLQYRAGKLAADIRQTGELLKPVGRGAVDLSDAACLKANRPTAMKMVASFKRLKKDYAETKYYKDAAEYLQGLGLKL